MKKKSILFIFLALFFIHCNPKNNSSVNENISADNQEKNIENQQVKSTAQGILMYYADAFTFTFCNQEGKQYFVKPDSSLLEYERMILHIDEKYLFIEANYFIEEVINVDGLLSTQIILKDIQQVEGC